MLDLLEFLLDLVTLESRKRGPLVVTAEMRSREARLTLEDKGKRKLEFAAVEGRDREGKRHFPESDLAARTVLHPGGKETLTIRASQLGSLDCQSMSRNRWSVLC